MIICKLSQKYNNLDADVQEIWNEHNFAKKKQLMLKLVTKFTFKDKTEEIIQHINKCKTNYKLDKLAANLVLIQTGDRVI